MFKSLINTLFVLFGFIALGNEWTINRKDCLKEIVVSQLGVREATGRNDGVAVEKYLASTGLGKGYAWCAAFVNWSLEQCGVTTKKSAWSPSWFPNEKIIYIRGQKVLKPPEFGDVFGIYFKSKKRVAHVGFIEWWRDGNYVSTIEGNTNQAGSREGDGVYRKRRLKRQIYLVARWE